MMIEFERQGQELLYDELFVNQIQDRFKTYGYERVKTPTFEKYDLYAGAPSIINRAETVKLIDRAGEVFVLRPDVTIPITKKLADRYSTLPTELKYYYVQDVFRQRQVTDRSMETMQAGVEYFCEQAPEKDAEVVALACHTLRDVGFQQVKIEIGHAGFVQALMREASLGEKEVSKIKSLIQTKNIPDLQRYLHSIEIEESLVKDFLVIPTLYGNPIQVSERARAIARTEEMHEALDYMLELCDLLSAYGIEEELIVDFGLINHMGYYSGITFQAFVQQVGQPVIMGGRYNHLGEIFQARLPAIGFACFVDVLSAARNNHLTQAVAPDDVQILYDPEYVKQSIVLALHLRERGEVVTTSLYKKSGQDQVGKAVFTVELTEYTKVLIYREESFNFTTIKECLAFMDSIERGREDDDIEDCISDGQNERASHYTI